MTDLFNPTEDHRELRQMLRRFSEQHVDPQAERHDAEEKFNHELFRRLGSELGILGLTVSPEYGGAGEGAVSAVIVHEELSAADPAFCLSYLAHSMLFANNLQHNGSPEQRARFLPKVCSGESIGGMCMSEPAAGTDVLGMKTTATLNGDHYIIDGSKMWITNGAVDDETPGDIFLVYARTGPERRNISLFIVEKEAPGFALGQRIKGKLGMRASPTAELVFTGCRVPAENLIGREGEATLQMMRNLEIERLTLAAMSLGIARRSIEVMNRYASERQSFGTPLRNFGQIQRFIAESYAEFMAGRSYVYQTAAKIDLDSSGNRVDSDGVKLFCAEMGKRVADRAIQVLGGYGYVSEYQVERLWRDAKLLEIGGGTAEAHQKNITNDLGRNTIIR